MRIPGVRSIDGDVSPSTVVGHDGTHYPCPDVPSVDQHLRELRRRVRRANGFPDLVAALQDEMDLLLDRRLWLEICGESTCEERKRSA